MDRLPASKVREGFPDALDQVLHRGARIIVHHRGKDVAALVPMEDLKLLEQIEDRLDLEEARAILKEMRETGEKSVPWEQVKKELGL